MNINCKGQIHSIESLGAVDGPGVRTVLFLQGCPLRCQYCHNPDTWAFNTGKLLSVDEVFEKISRYKPYFSEKGGVTLSGGEPLAQPSFCLNLIKKCRRNSIHTAIDTSGAFFNETVKGVIDSVDLVILDVKHTDPDKYNKLTCGDYSVFQRFFDYCVAKEKDLWIRQVIVPGITDYDENIIALANLANKAKATRVELLPYHDMGKYKWETLDLNYSLEGVTPPSKEKMDYLNKLFVNNLKQ